MRTRKTRIHLSTALLLLLLASLLVGANISTRGPYVIGMHAETVNLATVRGWPFAFQCVEVHAFLPEDGEWVFHWPNGAFGEPKAHLVDFRSSRAPKPLEFLGSTDEGELIVKALFFDLAIALGALILVALICEVSIRKNGVAVQPMPAHRPVTPEEEKIEQAE